MKTKLITFLILVVCVVAFTFNTAAASNIGVTVSDDGAFSNTGVWTLGYSFKADSAISVIGLGAYDHLGDGLNVEHAVGLWDARGNLLASATVPAGSGASMINNFRFVSIPTVTLNANDLYYVGAVYGYDNDAWLQDPTTLVPGPGITYDSRRYASSGGSLVFPNLAGSGNTGYFGGNFEYTAVPLPPAILLLGSGLMGLAGLRRKFK